MLRQAFTFNGLSVYVNAKKRKGSILNNFEVVFDFCFDNLFFVVFESRLWAVECLEKGKSLLIFDGLELVKVET